MVRLASGGSLILPRPFNAKKGATAAVLSLLLSSTRPLRRRDLHRLLADTYGKGSINAGIASLLKRGLAWYVPLFPRGSALEAIR